VAVTVAPIAADARLQGHLFGHAMPNPRRAGRNGSLLPRTRQRLRTSLHDLRRLDCDDPDARTTCPCRFGQVRVRYSSTRGDANGSALSGVRVRR